MAWKRCEATWEQCTNWCFNYQWGGSIRTGQKLTQLVSGAGHVSLELESNWNASDPSLTAGRKLLQILEPTNYLTQVPQTGFLVDVRQIFSGEQWKPGHSHCLGNVSLPSQSWDKHHSWAASKWTVRPSIIRAIIRVDPIDGVNRLGQRIVRGPYCVAHCNFLWHMDTNMELWQRRLCIHGCVDSYLWLINHLRVSVNNRATTVLTWFQQACQVWGTPSRVRKDYGGENVTVGEYLVWLRGQVTPTFLWPHCLTGFTRNLFSFFCVPRIQLSIMWCLFQFPLIRDKRIQGHHFRYSILADKKQVICGCGRAMCVCRGVGGVGVGGHRHSTFIQFPIFPDMKRHHRELKSKIIAGCNSASLSLNFACPVGKLPGWPAHLPRQVNRDFVTLCNCLFFHICLYFHRVQMPLHRGYSKGTRSNLVGGHQQPPAQGQGKQRPTSWEASIQHVLIRCGAVELIPELHPPRGSANCFSRARSRSRGSKLQRVLQVEQCTKRFWSCSLFFSKWC